MKIRRIFVVFGIVFAIVGFLTPIEAQQTKNTLKISGTSTRLGSPYHEWACEASPVLMLENNGNAEPIDGFLKGITNLSMTVAVENLACNNTKGNLSKLERNQMEGKLRDALKSKKNPNIVFKMTQYKLKGNGKAMVTGNLTIAGETKSINFNVELTEHVNSTCLQAKGFLEGDELISMTDYHVNPPQMFFGALVVGNDVKIEFDVVIQPPVESN